MIKWSDSYYPPSPVPDMSRPQERAAAFLAEVEVSIFPKALVQDGAGG